MLSYRNKKLIIMAAFILACMLYSFKVIEYRNRTNLTNFTANALTTSSSTSIEEIIPLEVTNNIESTSSVEPSDIEVETNYNIESSPEELNTYIDLSEDEIYELATLVYLESGIEPYECQLAVASVVVNRMTTTGQSLQEVIYAKNQFSPAYLIESSEPNESTLSAVKEVVQNGPTIPEYVTFFRADYYHNWSDLIVPYCVYGNTYFSADVRLTEE